MDYRRMAEIMLKERRRLGLEATTCTPCAIAV